MITWNKVKHLSEDIPWLVEALKMLRNPDDSRPLPKRVRESIAFIAFRPFEKADPEWHGRAEYHPIFHNSRQAGLDGAMCSSYPVVVHHYQGLPEYYVMILLPSGGECNCSIQEHMQWYIDHDRQRLGCQIVFDAIIKPLQVKLSPHNMFAESYEIYKFPVEFNFAEWIVSKRRVR